MPAYSKRNSDANHALEVWEKVGCDYCESDNARLHPETTKWVVVVRLNDSGPDFEAEADTLPIAICLAALRSVGVEVEWEPKA